MRKILDNPREFLENLSTKEFEELLNEFGFEYEDISNNSPELKAIKKYIQNLKIGKLKETSLFRNNNFSISCGESIKLSTNDLLNYSNATLIKDNEVNFKEQVSNNFNENIEDLKAA